MDKEYEKDNDRILEIMKDVKEREKRTLMRLLKKGEIDYDSKLDKLVYANTSKEYKLDGDDSGNEDDEDDEEDW